MVAWWYTSIIPALKKLRQENCCVFKANLGVHTSSPVWSTMQNAISKIIKRKKKEKPYLPLHLTMKNNG